MREIELKFIIPKQQLSQIMKRMQVKAAKYHELDAYYFDTPQQLLGKRGIALRMRNEDGQWVQTIKAHIDGLSQRIEENVSISHDSPNVNSLDKPEIDLTLFSKQTQKMLSQVMPLSQLSSVLMVKFGTEVNRITRNIVSRSTSDQSNSNDTSKQVVEIAFDTGKIISGELEQPICEIEFELISGSIEFLTETCKTWVGRYGLHYSTVSKAGAGSRLFAKGHATTQLAPVVMSTRKQFKPAANITGSDFLKSAIQNCLLHILPNLTEIANFAEADPNNENPVCSEHFFGRQVHQSRVGLRRLRTLLSHAHKFDAYLTKEVVNHWHSALKQVFQALGHYRDIDIIITQTQPNLQTLGAPSIKWQAPCKQTVAKAVINKQLQQVILELICYVSTPTQLSDAKKPNKQKSAKNILDKIINKQFNQVAKQSSQFVHLTIEAQHDVRKQLKKLRYLCEFAKPLYANAQSKKENAPKINDHKKPIKIFLTYLKPAQDILGQLNDASVGKHHYQTLCKNNADAWFAVGYFTAKEVQIQNESANALKTLKFAPKFW